MKTGLTLGKFAPLHHGHQYLIETALQEVDELYILIYQSAETTNVPLDVRANWLRSLYPNAKVIEGWNGPADMGDTDAIKKLQEDYVINMLGNRKITHFYSSEFYGDHMSKALGATDRVVDFSRTKFQVSATGIRNNLYQHRHFLSDLVYHDLIINVVFLGAPSTGKTTIAETLAAEFQTCWMPEYGREYWEAHQVNRRLTKEQLVDIARGHLERENQFIKQANQYLFTDTNALTTYQFSLYYHNEADPELACLAMDAEERYDLVLLCDTDIPYDDTWDRSGDVNRLEFQQSIIKDLEERKVKYILLSGSLLERINKVKEILSSFDKYAGK